MRVIGRALMWSKKWERLSNHIEKFCVEIDIKVGELMTARKVLLGSLGFSLESDSWI